MSLELCSVKEEVEECVSEGGSASLEAVCVKSELELGPELIQPQDAAWALRGSSTKASEAPEVKPKVQIYSHRARSGVSDPALCTQDPTYDQLKQEREDPVKDEAGVPDGNDEQRPLKRPRHIKPFGTVKEPIYNDGSVLERNALVCKICNETFRTQQHLTRHILARHVYCTECNKEFESKSSYNIHMSIHLHVKCDFCKKTFHKNSGLLLHQMNKHCEVNYMTCTVCDNNFPFESVFNRLVKRVPGKILFSCGICDCRFGLKWKAFRHTKRHFEPYVCDDCEKGSHKHAFKTYTTAPRNNQSKLTPSVQNTCPESINTKAKTTATGKNVTRTVKVEKHPKERLRPLRYPNRARNKDSESTKDPSCDSTKNPSFATGKLEEEPKVIIKKEIDICDGHSEEKPTVQQSISGQVQSEKPQDDTIKEVHNPSSVVEKNPFVCKVCNETFSRIQLLKAHCWKQHEAYCLPCDRQFDSVSSFKTHLPKHKPCKCEFCDKSFPRKHLLTAHHMLMHFEEKRLTVKCQMCQENFTIKSVGNSYIKEFGHSRFECTACEKKFCRRSMLIEHIQVHFDVFSCEVCTDRVRNIC